MKSYATEHRDSVYRRAINHGVAFPARARGGETVREEQEDVAETHVNKCCSLNAAISRHLQAEGKVPGLYPGAHRAQTPSHYFTYGPTLWL